MTVYLSVLAVGSGFECSNCAAVDGDLVVAKARSLAQRLEPRIRTVVVHDIQIVSDSSR